MQIQRKTRIQMVISLYVSKSSFSILPLIQNHRVVLKAHITEFVARFKRFLADNRHGILDFASYICGSCVYNHLALFPNNFEHSKIPAIQN